MSEGFDDDKKFIAIIWGSAHHHHHSAADRLVFGRSDGGGTKVLFLVPAIKKDDAGEL